MEKVKLGIVGLGRLGREHAANINYNIINAELTAVCSAVKEEVDSIMKEMNPSYGTTDYMELFNDKNLDGIVIASNSAFHCQMICDAANAGVKNIYCEKPLGMTLEEIELIKETVEKNNVQIFQIGYNRRFDRSLMTMKEKIDAGFIGKPILIKLANRDPEWDREHLLRFSPTSGGLVFDMLTHDYDAARWLIGSDAETVYGMGGAFGYEGLAEINDIDNCIISIGFENGVMGHLETSRNSTYGYHVEVEVFGTEGCLRMGTTPNKDRVVSMDRNGVNTECVKWFFEFWEPTFKAELQDFADCIQNNRQPKAGLMDGYKAVQWAFAAKEAVDKRIVVNMK
ncbi:Gfo/Idh/MocA family oxidoreductase [Sinanaerobacter chloroacetimidivorans]|jgi:myo-inositol 2-dehydrogenase/D-chiro-inositol 1-dehydrogenase|uniref:Gfo/Idh/MocA family oxidoreductase n=1 Tax=Sinanaerobacter chloroacetimidivorans TaxID=2818044 RepID=A0A8J8B339_9FIRM|nr:Gfo/Idh/MocA family oxidoreductase [Sinanaerobacter chloroacetimidivorans]MBR0600458.1 Gfo/Idh/MocA family oxidoreductase [Sinanaerobacter chloroacetimidivorans]